MDRIPKLTQLVHDFYEKNRATWIPEWTEYLYNNHVFFVGEVAKDLSTEFGVNPEFSVAASILHDIADAIMDRNHTDHAEQSENIAHRLLLEAGYTTDEIQIIVGDIMNKHSCRNNIKPTTLEGKIMATADAIGHLTTDFYQFAISQKKKNESIESIRKWGLLKIERDFYEKIFFDEIRERYRKDYERCKLLF